MAASQLEDSRPRIGCVSLGEARSWFTADNGSGYIPKEIEAELWEAFVADLLAEGLIAEQQYERWVADGA